MARRSIAKKRKRQDGKSGWWSSLNDDRRRRLLWRSGWTILVTAVVLGGTVAAGRLEAYVHRELSDCVERPTLTFLDLPSPLDRLARSELSESVADLLARDWMDDQLCPKMAARLTAVGWVAKVNFVRRTSDARFEISACYRTPIAMVRQQGEFLLIDGDGLRLPGTYLYDPTWILIEGVSKPAPTPGTKWPGGDVPAGLNLISALAAEPFSHQITAVIVDNFNGRIDSGRSHVELATDRAGGRIRWGSAPGFEVEENSVLQKLAILRENHRRTGRADADHAVIDISVFPDRFTIPG